MAVSPENRSAQDRLSRVLLLVGPEGVSLRQTLLEQLASREEGIPWEAAVAESLLEAVLLAGESRQPDVIVAGIGRELEHLEAGVRSLRQVNPTARLLLLCDPSDEVICRKALAWGADDYAILPLDARDLDLSDKPHRAGGGRSDASPFPPSPALAPFNGPGASEFQPMEPAIPLAVQTELLDELLAGRPDFPQRAIAALARHLRLPGGVQFVSGSGPNGVAPPAIPGQVRRAVAIDDQPPFGFLQVETGSPLAPQAAALLAQAAHWLAAMLAVSRRYEQLRSLAITDELSGAYNRRYFMKYMASLLERAKENRFRVTLLLFDIDDFKKYNDTFGHASGDAIIRELIKLLRACTRPHDLVARIGGDEFAVVYWDNEAPRQPNSEHPKDVLVATERFREAIKNHQWPQTCNIQGEISISGGLATFPWDADSLELLMAKADEALLRAKAAGKNVIVMHGAVVEKPERGMQNAER